MFERIIWTVLVSSILKYWHFHTAAALQQHPAMSSLRQRLLRGGKSYGPLVMSDSPIVTEVLSLAG